MALPGTAFLALWNDREEKREDYEAWHTREHLPERLSVPGILAGRRYVAGDGPLPDYFTLYPLSDLVVLNSEAYLAVVDQPTAWSQSMRPAMSRFYRLGCEKTVSIGGGIGGCLAATLLKAENPVPNASAFRAIADLPAFTALHLGDVAEVPALPFAGAAPSDLPAAEAVLLVEGFDPGLLALSLEQLDPLIATAGYRTLLPWTTYAFAYSIDQAARDTLPPFDANALIRSLARLERTRDG
jgi:hypothetical protein